MKSAETCATEMRVRVSLPYTTPVVGCEIKPHVFFPSQGVQFLNQPHLTYSWYKKQIPCSMHPDKPSTFQCASCVKLKLPVENSYHCSQDCFKHSWQAHELYHRVAVETKSSTDNHHTESKLRSSGSWDGGCISYQDSISDMEQAAKTWIMVGYSRNYIPKREDVGSPLKLECAVIELSHLSPVVTVTDPVIEFPDPHPRTMIKINYSQEYEAFCRQFDDGITFSILCYNVLCHLAAICRHEYCPSWALSWEYRQKNLLREIIGYSADILCLQEVQSDHLEEFFEPELSKRGYAVIYKEKTRSIYADNKYIADGCAIFYRNDLFKEVSSYKLEFNQIAAELVESLETELRSEASIHFRKDNVAVVSIFEIVQNDYAAYSSPTRLCVANTHIFSDPLYADVKFLQVATLVEELEKIVKPEVPVVICGDFNCLPRSDPHKFMLTGIVDVRNDTLDPYDIYKHLKLHHSLHLASAYASFCQEDAVDGRELCKMDLKTKEPMFTTIRPRSSKSLDYIFYSVDNLKVEGLLELLDKEDLRTGLPSPLWSSDHIALSARFRVKPLQYMPPLVKRTNYRLRENLS